MVGSGSWIDPVPLHEMATLGLLSRARRGAASYRPFDRRRDGFLAGEGGAALVLERRGHAAARSARVLATIEGVASATEPMPGLGVSDRVTLRAMQLALDDAHRGIADIGLICPHGAGTPRGDRSEARSMLELLGDAAGRVPISALKPYTGHMGAASDLAEVILGVFAVAQGTAPATPNFEASEPQLAGLRVSAQPQRCQHPRLLSASFGIGGQGSAVVASAPHVTDYDDGHS